MQKNTYPRTLTAIIVSQLHESLLKFILTVCFEEDRLAEMGLHGRSLYENQHPIKLISSVRYGQTGASHTC
jgi:hypothetical protein